MPFYNRFAKLNILIVSIYGRILLGDSNSLYILLILDTLTRNNISNVITHDKYSLHKKCRKLKSSEQFVVNNKQNEMEEIILKVWGVLK